MAAVDDQAFENPLHVGPGLVEGDAFDPVDRIDVRRARIAERLDPAVRPRGSGVVGGQRQDVGAVVVLGQAGEVGAAQPQVVLGIGEQLLAAVADLDAPGDPLGALS